MTAGFLPQHVERFRATVALRLGLWFDDGKLEQLAGVLGRRLRAVDDEAPRYLSRLEAHGKPAELRESAQELTVGETYFFRHKDQFSALSEIALPARIQARARPRQLRLLSAGCSSGEEAYSLSIVARARTTDTGVEIAVSAVDLNPRSLERAREARYSLWALRETPGDLRERYFEIDGRDYVLSRAIRDSVEFQEENLVADDTWANDRIWLETVQRSADRIRELTENPALGSVPAEPARALAAPARAPTAARLELGPVLELLSQERFAEALRALTPLPSDGAAHPDTLLLRAALLTHCDHLQEADRACLELLAIDGLNAGAHYLRSLCQERQGDTRAAVELAQVASYLDPAFAMPHLHLGLLARRTGDRGTAQRELSQASQLLLGEEPARLLMFGGGFSREALVALCRSELERLGGSS